jgi:hypothetical protein
MSRRPLAVQDPRARARVGVCLVLIMIGLAGARWVLGQAGAPTPLRPAPGDQVVIPTFSWLASGGATKYEVQVGPSNDPNLVYWSATTLHLNLTPTTATDLPNEALYWRLRAYDEDNQPGPWSNRIQFIKYIPAPTLLAPTNHIAVSEPALAWGPIAGAAYYQVQVTQDATFNSVDYVYSTYATDLTPQSTIAPATYYWRVSGVDARGHVGTPSAVRSFVKHIPAPVLVAPSSGASLTVPSLEWEASAGAAYYKVELSKAPTFAPVDYSYTTYRTSLTPVSTIAPGTYQWRVRGVDADGHEGTNSSVWSVTVLIPPPLLVAPSNGVTVTVPTLEWKATEGAAYYELEASTDRTFNSVTATYTSYNTRLTPVGALGAGVYYWRVRGVDADGHRGTNSESRQFTLASAPTATDAVPQLQLPANAEIIASDPTFCWTRVAGAARYRVVVSTNPAFSSTYDDATTVYACYTPYTPGSKDTYVNGTYYWKVEARSSTNTVIATSEVRTFTKTTLLPLVGPADAAILDFDPMFRWSQVVGAKSYRLVLSTSPTFASTYDEVSTDYTSYAPYTPGIKDTYVNGTYYWKVEARSSTNTVIATSETRTFTKSAFLPLVGPADGMTLSRDPTFQWSQVVGSKQYRLVVSSSPTFASTYDEVTTDYTSYTPYTPGIKDTYVNDTYYWKVEARSSTSVVIVTSPVHTFTKSAPVHLLAPSDGSTTGSTPSFSWEQVLGAKSYRLVVSTSPAFASTYDSVSTDYTAYTPYTPGTRDAYAEGTYYWKVEARSSTNVVIATSLTWVFTISSSQPTTTPIGAPTLTPTATRTARPTPTQTLVPTRTPTLPGPSPTVGPPPANRKTLGSVTIYADTFLDLGDNRWRASGRARLGSSTAAYVDLGSGTVTLDYGAMSIEGSKDSTVSLIMDSNTLTVVFSGSFSVDPSSGEVHNLASPLFRLASLGDMRVDSGTPLADLAMNVLQGTVGGRARITVYEIEGSFPSAGVQFTLHHTGQISGGLTLGDLEFDAAGVTFEVEAATLSYDPVVGGRITIGRASVSLPEEFCPLGAKGSVEGVVITHNGLESVSGLEITLTLPDMDVPGTGGKFKLAGAEVTMSLAAGGKYMIHARADFSLPNVEVRSTSHEVGLFAEFELDQDGLRYVLMGGEVDPGIPIGQTGFALTGLEGRVQLEPVVRVEITGSIESELEIPPLGPLVKGEPALWFQLEEPLGIGVTGEVQVLIFKAAEASLSLSQGDGLRGSVQINYLPYALSGNASLHVWRSGGEFHFTGSATVALGFAKGALYEACKRLCLFGYCKTVCLSVPPFDTRLASVGCEFGEFCANMNCASSVYGLKGSVSVFGWEGAFFVDINGNLSAGDDADEYALRDQPASSAELAAAGLLAVPYTDTHQIQIGVTDQALFALTWEQGAPVLSLVDPLGRIVDRDTFLTDPAITYTEVLSNVYYVVNEPFAGTWQAQVANLEGQEFYLLTVLGSNAPPTVSLQGVTSQGVGSYDVHWSAGDTDDQATLSLYYDTDQGDADGTLIASGLDPASGHYTWDASQVRTGDYYVYARVDDLKNVPVVDYSPESVHVDNVLPPAAPTGVEATVSPVRRELSVCWQRNAEADVIGYNVYFGTQPGTYDLGAYNATNVTCFDLPLPAWMQVGYVAISAYDNSGNESALSREVQVMARLTYGVYLPVVQRRR